MVLQYHAMLTSLCLTSSDGNPSTVYPLGLCRGDCDNDQECLGNLVCYQRDSFQAVPGCLGGEGDSSKTDYCIQPPGGGPTPRPTPQATPRPTVMPTNRPTDRPTPAPLATAMIEFMGNGTASHIFLRCEPIH